MQADNAYSSSGECGSEESVDRSQDNGKYMFQKQSLDQPSAQTSGPEAAGNVHVGIPEGSRLVSGQPPPEVTNSQMMMSEKPALAGPSLNMGMEYWSGSGATPAAASDHEMLKSHCVPGALLPTVGSLGFSGPSSDGGSGDLWVQDEREMKRQKRKQANRESAKRSRMRKQVEFEDLAGKVESLTGENNTLKLEVGRLSDLCKKLSSENSSLLERIHKAQGAPQQLHQQET